MGMDSLHDLQDPVDILSFRKIGNSDTCLEVHNVPLDPSPVPSSSTIQSSKLRTKIRLQWTNLMYHLRPETATSPTVSSKRKSGGKHVERNQILQQQDGFLEGGNLVALMGPSGAGKTTLLNCITGKITDGVKGDIKIFTPQRGPHSLVTDGDNIRISFVPQSDNLFGQFTLKETLLFASKLTNKSGTNHSEKIHRMFTQLDLMEVANHKISSLSGGQMKRAAIATELISDPAILLLDEPTSGLDSDNSETVVSLLRNLCNSPASPAIISTIHQPSYEVFNMFTSVYLMSRAGHCLYFDEPQQLIPFICSFGFKRPSNVNPADYAIEIANGKFGTDQFEAMSVTTKGRLNPIKTNGEDNHVTWKLEGELDVHELSAVVTSAPISKGDENGNNLNPEGEEGIDIINYKQRINCGFFYGLWLTFCRSMSGYLFKSWHTIAKVILNILVTILVCMLWEIPLGPENGCWSSAIDLNNGTTPSDALKNAIFNAATNQETRTGYLNRISRITGNVNLMFLTGMYYMLVSTICTVLLVPLEMRIIMKEVSNSWYSLSSYFISKSITDFLLLLVTSTVSIFYEYYMTDQIDVSWRFGAFYWLIILFCQVCESQGTLIGIIFCFDPITATIVATTTIFPTVIFSGFLVKSSSIPSFLRPMTFFSHLKYFFEGTLLTIYGFNRCEGGAVLKNFVDDLQQTDKHPLSLLGTVWGGLNITSGDTKRFSILLGLEEDQLGPVFDAITDYLGTSHYHDSDAVDGVDEGGDPEDYEPSYVLSYFNIQDDMLYFNVSVLLGMVIVLRIASFIALQFKVRGKRL